MAIGIGIAARRRDVRRVQNVGVDKFELDPGVSTTWIMSIAKHLPLPAAG